MKKKFKFLVPLVAFHVFILPLQLFAAYTLKDGQVVNVKLVATKSLEDHYKAGADAFEAGRWKEAAGQFAIVALNFPLSPYGQEAAFYQGVSEYNLGEYGIADEVFTAYLQGKNTPRLFEEALGYKFAIAEQFRNGARCRLFNTKKLPKLFSGESHAIKIYDEVVATVPCHELAVKSLYAKGHLHWKRNEYSNAIDCFQMITRRFPKHELCPESYLLINKVYLDQSRCEFQNPDILALAEINARRFALSFPREERIAQMEESVLAIKEVYAKGFYETGCFYERIKRPQAAILYYRHAIIQFPETQIASLSHHRLGLLGYQMESKHEEDKSKEVAK